MKLNAHSWILAASVAVGAVALQPSAAVAEVPAVQKIVMVDLQRVPLDDTHAVMVGMLPPSLLLDVDGFEALWSTHPGDFHEIKMHGRLVKTPRWQQAYGADYRYTGNTNRALPVTPKPMASWPPTTTCCYLPNARCSISNAHRARTVDGQRSRVARTATLPRQSGASTRSWPPSVRRCQSTRRCWQLWIGSRVIR